ncbi:hypothetical protein [Cetobacterium sp. SF1]|uniref:hypothetical protein n=1 Tax=Cetobacterium sp. SF1 TaxID=3417654 RepID=UPI003CEA11B6
MAINIETKHLRLLKLLNFTKGKHLKFLEFFLNTNKANINSYIRDLYNLIPNNKSQNKLDKIIEEILNENFSLFKSEVKEVSLSKKDRIFFLTLRLLLKTTLNLQYLSTLLEVSRRTLNDDILQLKTDLKIYDLTIVSFPGKGIFLEGNLLNRKRALCTYIYKYLVEEDHLPQIFKEYFFNIFHVNEIDNIFQEEMEHFIELGNCDIFFYNRELLKSFYISFKYLDDDILEENQIKNQLFSPEKFNYYFSDIFQQYQIETIYNFFKDSLLGEISVEYIHNFINILKISKGLFPEKSKDLPVYYNIFRNILGSELKEDDFLDNFISRSIFCKAQKHYLPIYEMSFLNLCLDEITIEKSIEIFIKLREFFWNISFTDVISLHLYLNSKQNQVEEKNIILVYNNIPKILLEQLKSKIEVHNNVNITDFVNINFFDSFSNKNKNIGIIEPLLKKSLKNFKVKNLIIPA